MRHSSKTLLIPALALTLLGGGQVTAAEGVAPATSCSTLTPVWPDQGDAEGATFVGRMTGTFVSTMGLPGIRFKVLKVEAGDIGASIKVVLNCTRIHFKVGLRYLVSGGESFPADGSRINRIRFHSSNGVAWRVKDADTILLKGYGPGTAWDEAPAYLTRPDALREAVRAVTAD